MGREGIGKTTVTIGTGMEKQDSLDCCGKQYNGMGGHWAEQKKSLLAALLVLWLV